MGMEYWIVTEFHPNLDLHNFTTLNVGTGLIAGKFSYFRPSTSLRCSDSSLRSPLALNTFTRKSSQRSASLAWKNPINCQSLGKKPFIAHRDLKASNVMVKSDLTCCIGDFGLAAYYQSWNDAFISLMSNKKGTLVRFASYIKDSSAMYFSSTLLPSF